MVPRVQLAVSSVSGGGSLAGGHGRCRRLKGRSYLSYATRHVTHAVTPPGSKADGGQRIGGAQVKLFCCGVTETLSAGR